MQLATPLPIRASYLDFSTDPCLVSGYTTLAPLSRPPQPPRCRTSCHLHPYFSRDPHSPVRVTTRPYMQTTMTRGAHSPGHGVCSASGPSAAGAACGRRRPSHQSIHPAPSAPPESLRQHLGQYSSIPYPEQGGCPSHRAAPARSAGTAPRAAGCSSAPLQGGSSLAGCRGELALGAPLEGDAPLGGGPNAWDKVSCCCG